MGASMKYFTSFVLVFFCTFFLIPQEKEIREDMVVINVEVPVRVMHKGKPVDNLKKSDFKLFENGKEIDINGFNIVRKKISSQSIELNSERKQYYEPRLFVLVFHLVEYNQHIRKGLEYMFEKVLRESDRLMIMANNKLLKFNDLKDKKGIHEIIKSVLKKEGLIAKGILLKYMDNVKMVIPFASKSVYLNIAPMTALTFIERYLMNLKEYKRRYLNSDIGVYYNFSKYLEKLKYEKWVINFYQFQMFPKMKTASILQEIEKTISKSAESTNATDNVYSRLISKKLNEVYKERNFENTFPTEEISKLFYKVNTTFHSVFIPTTIESFEKDMEYARIATALENNLREITKKTGGTLITTHNLSDAIKKISKKEDVLYMLTYAPSEGSKPGKIKINVGNKKYKVLYDNNMRADYITGYLKKRAKEENVVGIDKIEFKDKKLIFELNNFELIKNKEKKNGSIKVEIIVKDSVNNIIYEKAKIIYPERNHTDMVISFNWLRQGKYDLIIDVRDLVSSKTAFEYLKIEVK